MTHRKAPGPIRRFRHCLTLAIGMALLATAAHAAPLVWNLADVSFDDGTTASGYLVYDASTNIYSSWSITVGTGLLPAFVYDPASSIVDTETNADAMGVLLAPADFVRYLNLNYLSPLTDAGGTVDLDNSPFSGSFDSASWECDNCDDARYVLSGRLVAAPRQVDAPASFALLAAALGMLGLERRRRRPGG